MVGFGFRHVSAAAAVAAVLVCAAPAAAAETGYSIVGASHSRVNHSYLTVDSVTAKLRPSVASQMPAGGRLVLLNVMFRATGDSGKMVQLVPSDLQVQWDDAGTRGAAPVLGAHISKDFWAMSGGFYTSMRPDKYELFAIVPATARALDLAQRQPDGSFKVVKANIALIQDTDGRQDLEFRFEFGTND